MTTRSDIDEVTRQRDEYRALLLAAIEAGVYFDAENFSALMDEVPRPSTQETPG